MNPEVTSSPEQLIEEISRIEELLIETKKSVNLRIIWIKNEKNKLEDELIETQTKLLNILDIDSDYTDLIELLKWTKKQLLNSKWHNKFSIGSEILDLCLPIWWIAAFISAPATATDMVSQVKLKNKLEKLYVRIENDNTLDLNLKHIKTSQLWLVIEAIETWLEFLNFIKPLILSLSLLKIWLTGHNTYLLWKISKELNEINDYLLDKLQKK